MKSEPVASSGGVPAFRRYIILLLISQMIADNNSRMLRYSAPLPVSGKRLHFVLLIEMVADITNGFRSW